MRDFKVKSVGISWEGRGVSISLAHKVVACTQLGFGFKDVTVFDNFWRKCFRKSVKCSVI